MNDLSLLSTATQFGMGTKKTLVAHGNSFNRYSIRGKVSGNLIYMGMQTKCYFLFLLEIDKSNQLSLGLSLITINNAHVIFLKAFCLWGFIRNGAFGVH